MKHRLSLPCFAAAVMLALSPLSEKASAQYSSDYSIGIRGGANWGYISNIGGILISEDYYSNYTLKENKKAGGVGCLFLNARIPETILAFQPEISYSTRSTKLRYDDVYGLWYEADFKYQFVCIGVMAKVYPVAGLITIIGSPDHQSNIPSNLGGCVGKTIDYARGVPENETGAAETIMTWGYDIFTWGVSTGSKGVKESCKTVKEGWNKGSLKTMGKGITEFGSGTVWPVVSDGVMTYKCVSE